MQARDSKTRKPSKQRPMHNNTHHHNITRLKQDTRHERVVHYCIHCIINRTLSTHHSCCEEKGTAAQAAGVAPNKILLSTSNYSLY